jgi:hypothetical protein
MCPRLKLAIADRGPCTIASLIRWTHQLGVTGGMCGVLTPTWSAIELSSLVEFADG